MDSVLTMEDLSSFVEELRRDLREHSDEWESLTLDDYLEALSASIDAIPQSYLNQGRVYPERPTWFMFAELLNMASRYE